MKTKTAHFVGGPLHGATREIRDHGEQFHIPPHAANALKASLAGEEPAAPDPLDLTTLTYVRRHDGKYYLAIEAPAGFNSPPPYFEFDWFDVSDGMKMVEVRGPKSRNLGSQVRVEITFSDDLLADGGIADPTDLVMSAALPNILDIEERFARSLTRGQMEGLAEAIGAGTGIDQGTRRLTAAVLRVAARSW